jgi:hypothetical protein
VRGSRLRLPLTSLVAAFAFTGAVGPPRALFRTGYDLCRAAPLAAIRAAGGQPYRAGVLANGTCTWERADLRAGISVSVHPSTAGAELIRGFLDQNGTHGVEARRVGVPGASRAVLVTVALPGSTQPAKDLLAAFRAGVVQVNMTAPRTLPDGRLLAVMHALTRP